MRDDDDDDDEDGLGSDGAEVISIAACSRGVLSLLVKVDDDDLEPDRNGLRVSIVDAPECPY